MKKYLKKYMLNITFALIGFLFFLILICDKKDETSLFEFFIWKAGALAAILFLFLFGKAKLTFKKKTANCSFAKETSKSEKKESNCNNSGTQAAQAYFPKYNQNLKNSEENLYQSHFDTVKNRIITAFLQGQRLTTLTGNRIGHTVDFRKIVSVLRDEGYNIKGVWVKLQDGRRFKEYYLEQEKTPEA